jgi:integrase
LRAIWHALPDGDYGDIVRLLMLTGARRDEVGGLRWSEIDLRGEALITLPAARTKGRRPHEIPLSGPALAILKARMRDDGRDHVFGRGAGGFSGWSKAKCELDARLGEMSEWRLHDFRRSFSTTLHERLDIAPHVVEDALGHHATFRAGAAGTYNKSKYRDPKRRALDAWAAHLMAVING